MNREQRSKLNRSMTALADGDRQAFAVVFDLAWPVVEALAVKMLTNREDAGDVAQQVLFKIFEQVSQFEREKDALSWILTISYYECRTLRKKEVRQRVKLTREGQLPELLHDKDSQDDEMIKVEMENAVRAVLAELSDADRDVILASVAETERPSISPAAYRKRLQRAMKKLKNLWGVRHGD